MTRRSYPRPPIVEAVVDFRFSAEVTGLALYRTLSEALSEQYPGPLKHRDRVEVRAAIGQGSVSTSASSKKDLTFLVSGDERRLLGCGDGVLSSHVLAPYPGWEALITQTRDAMAAAHGLLEGHVLEHVAVRYIDRIVLPPNAESFNEMLPAMPARPDAMPSQLTGFHYVTQSFDPDARMHASLTLASGPRDEGEGPIVFYDLSLLMDGDPLCEAAGDDWLEHVEYMHDRQRDIFEGSITDLLRETFK